MERGNLLGDGTPRWETALWYAHVASDGTIVPILCVFRASGRTAPSVCNIRVYVCGRLGLVFTREASQPLVLRVCESERYDGGSMVDGCARLRARQVL